MPQALGCKSSQPISAGKELCARSDTLDSSNPFAAFRRWWGCSIVRLLAAEIYILPRRIQTTLLRSHLRFGYSLPLSPTFDHRESRGQGYEFLCACSEDIKELHRDNLWAGSLDLELAGAAYQAGANWAIHSFRKQITSMDSQHSSGSYNQVSESSQSQNEELKWLIQSLPPLDSLK